MFKFIAIETCAHCNRACSFCPTNNTVFPPKEFMPQELFDKIIADLVEINYCGGIGLYNHNEALLDANRLPGFIRLIKERLPNCGQTLSTNGDKLTIPLMFDLFASGLNVMLINLYDDKPKHRVDNIVAAVKSLPDFEVCVHPAGSYLFPMVHVPGKKTINVYDASRIGEWVTNRAGNVVDLKPKFELPLKENCNRPTTNATIKYNGNFILCCQDWKEQVVFGNVRETSVIDCYNSEIAKRYRKQLAQKNRIGLTLCESCDWFDK